jgi:hypothetical protein
MSKMKKATINQPEARPANQPEDQPEAPSVIHPSAQPTKPAVRGAVHKMQSGFKKGSTSRFTFWRKMGLVPSYGADVPGNPVMRSMYCKEGTLRHDLGGSSSIPQEPWS